MKTCRGCKALNYSFGWYTCIKKYPINYENINKWGMVSPMPATLCPKPRTLLKLVKTEKYKKTKGAGK